MAQFLDLPIDLLPVILRHIVRPHHLVFCCLVSRYFSWFGTPQLYEWIYIYAWHKDEKARVMKLFRTLAECPDLAKLVKKLELRDFPKAIWANKSFASLTNNCLRGLANCTTLQSCSWTRDSTLTNEILDVLSSRCSHLKELEINGNSTSAYNPEILLQFTSLAKISLIMPSVDVINILPTWLRKTGETLTAFNVLCKASTFITDSTLETLGRYMTQVKHLHLAGCPKVTHRGVVSVLLHNFQRIESLRLEGLSQAFDFSALRDISRPLTALTSLILTLAPGITTKTWPSAFRALTAQSRLTELNINVQGPCSRIEAFHLTDFVDSVVELHAVTLRKFSIHKMIIQPEVVGTICTLCPKLESLFVTVNFSSLDQLTWSISQSRSVRRIHVNFPHIGYAGHIQFSEILSIAHKLGTQVRQLGFANRVYQLDRIMRRSETNEMVMDLVLTPCQYPA